MDIRENLKIVIRDKGYIQAVIAKKANMAPCKLSQILNFERRLEANEMFALCRAMDMTPMELAEYKPRLPDENEVKKISLGEASINEIRKNHGLPPLNGCDELITSKEVRG